MSSKDEISVKIGADSSGLESGAKRSKSAVEGMAAATREQLQRMAKDAQDAEGGITRSFNGILGSIKGVIAGYLGFQGLQALVGITDQAAGLQARMVGVVGSVQAAADAHRQLYEVSQRLGASFNETVSSFTRMMPAVKELGGGVNEATKLSEIMVATARLSGASAAEASASALQFAQALGSGVLQGDELKSILENNQTLARTLAGALGVSIGELRKLGSEGKLTSEKVANALLGSYDKIKGQTDALPVTMGTAIQQIKNAWEALVGSFETGSGIFGTIARAVSEVAKVMDLLVARFRQGRDQSEDLGKSEGAKFFARTVGMAFAYLVDVVGAVITAFKTVGEDLGAVAAAFAAVARGEFSGAMEILRDRAKAGADAGREIEAAFTGAGKSIQAYKALMAGEDAGGMGNEGRGAAGGSPTLRGGAKPEEKKPEQNRMGRWENELASEKLAFARLSAQQGEYQNMSREQEAKFWQDKLNMQGLSAKEREAIEKKLLATRLADAERANNSQLEAQAIYADMQRQAAFGEIDAEERAARMKLERGQITNEQYLEQLAQFEQRRFDLQQSELLRRLEFIAANDPDAPAKRAEVYEKLLQLRMQYEERLAGISQQAAREQMALHRQLEQSMASGFQPIIEKFLKFQLKVSDLFKQLTRAVAQSVISMIAQIMAKKIAAWATEKALGVAQIGMEAAKAGAGAASSQAAIPVVGPGLALTSMATVFAAVSALAGRAGRASVPSASKGFDIPAGLNPLTQLHEKEMVLPAEQAEAIRDMAGQGGSKAPTFHIHAVDAQSVRRLFLDHGDALAEAVKRQRRNFAF